ncbi:hypothetical protein BH09VER1_BH09VER1_33220 [soil metagenome]
MRIFLFFCLVSLVKADEPLVEVLGQFVHATRAQMEAALDAAKARPTATLFTAEQIETIRAKLKESGAEIFSEPRATTQSGETAKVMAVREVCYPSEFEPSTQEKGKLVPKSFETRNAGVTLEVKVEVRADGRIRLLAHPTFTRFLGFIDYSNVKDVKPVLEDLLKAPLTAGGLWKPVFSTYSVESVFNLANGQTALMGGPVTVDKDFNTQGEDVFVFLTATVVQRN